MKPFDEEVSDDLAREVLASAQRDGPLAAARARALAAGITALAPVPPGTGGESGGTGGNLGSSIGKVGALKWFAAATGAAMVAGAIIAVRPSAKPAEAPSAPLPPSSIRVVTPAPTTTIEESAPSIAASALPDAPRKPSPSAPAPRDVLGDELALIDAARSLLRAGDPATALARLDAYERGHKNGSLRLESQVLRFEALARSGRRAEAAELGRSLLAEEGGSAYRARIEKILGEQP